MNSQELLKKLDEIREAVQKESKYGTITPISIGIYNLKLLSCLVAYIKTQFEKETK